MDHILLYATLLLTAIIALPLIRVLKGPTLFDRILATNAIATKTIVLICLIGFLYDRIGMFIDIILAYAILGFIGSLAIAKFIQSPKIRRHD